MATRTSGLTDKLRPVAAVRAIILDDTGRVLIIRRPAGTTGGGGWCLPGGKVDYGETLEQALRREVLEETALMCDSMRFLFYQDSLPFEPGGMHCLNLYFECRCSGTFRPTVETAGHAWIGPEDMPRYEMVFRNDEGLVRYWAATGPLTTSAVE